MARMMLGVFSDRDYANDALDNLSADGMDPKDISIIMKDEDGKVVEQHTGENVAGGAATGATTGGVVGGLAGLLIGLGALAIPGIGGILIGGPIAAALGLTGAAATTVSGALTGALAGGIVGALVGLGVPEEEAKVYESRIKEGAILVAVPVDLENESGVRDVMEAHHADQIRVVGSTTSKDLKYESEEERRHYHN